MKDPAVVSFCVFMGGDWKTTEWEKKFNLPEILLGVGQLKRKKLNAETIHDVWVSEWNLTLHSISLVDCKNRSISAKFVWFKGTILTEYTWWLLMTTDHTFCHNSQDLALQELTKNQSVRLICQPQKNHSTEKSRTSLVILTTSLEHNRWKCLCYPYTNIMTTQNKLETWQELLFMYK